MKNKIIFNFILFVAA